MSGIDYPKHAEQGKRDLDDNFVISDRFVFGESREVSPKEDVNEEGADLEHASALRKAVEDERKLAERMAALRREYDAKNYPQRRPDGSIRDAKTDEG
jgi:hypothetical protein